MSEKKMSPEKKAKLVEMLKFTLFSLSAGLIQLGSFAIFEEFTTWDYWPSYLISVTLSVLWNFTLNRKFTFKSSNNVPLAMLKVTLYYALFIPLSTWWGDALEKIGWNEYLILFITMLVNFVTEYLYCSLFVFTKKKTDAEPAKDK